MNHKQPTKHLAVKLLGVLAALSLALAAPALAQTFTWSDTGSLTYARDGGIMAMLGNGQVLMAGGAASAVAEIYDPLTGLWTTTGAMSAIRRFPTLTSLQDGRILAAGGNSSVGSAMNTAEYYSGGSWSSAGTMNYYHYYHTATQLQDGRVLVVGGASAGGACQSGAEIYTPGTPGSWAVTGSMGTVRCDHTATLLSDGRVLVAAGRSPNAVASAEIWNPATGLWTSAGSLTTARYVHKATRLSDGRVLVAGGFGSSGTLGSAEIYNPATGTWTGAASMNALRRLHTATRLSDGRVLVAGGSGPLASAEIYDPAANTWTNTDSLTHARLVHSAILLTTGNVLVAGGVVGDGSLAAELFDSEDPTAVTLASFTAAATGGGVRVAWETAGELDNAGFNLYRSVVAEGGYVKLNAALIPAQGGPTQGASYSYDDVDVAPGATYYYTLEDVDLYGRTTSHGPVAVVVGQMPTAIRLLGMSASQPWAVLVVVGLALGAGGLVVARSRSRRRSR